MFQHFVPHTRFRSIRAYRELLNSSPFMVQGFPSHAMSSPRKDFSRKLLALYRERHAVPLRGYSLFPCRKTATITDDLLPRKSRVVARFVFLNVRRNMNSLRSTLIAVKAISRSSLNRWRNLQIVDKM